MKLRFRLKQIESIEKSPLPNMFLFITTDKDGEPIAKYYTKEELKKLLE